jgi:hypothetical protein
MTDTVTVSVMEPGKASYPQTIVRDDLLEGLQAIVGGDVEIVYNDGGQIMLADMDGLLKSGQVRNHLASQQAAHARGFYAPIVGTVVLIADKDFD